MLCSMRCHFDRDNYLFTFLEFDYISEFRIENIVIVLEPRKKIRLRNCICVKSYTSVTKSKQNKSV